MQVDNFTYISYRQAFDYAPIGMVISRNRVIMDCNQSLCEMFMTSREILIGESFQTLYPSAAEYERTGDRIAPILSSQGRYADDRIMRRANGENFWCHVSGKAFDRNDPHASGVWCFEDLSAKRAVRMELSAREREVAAYLMEGHTSKAIGKHLEISHRTVEIYRARLMKKFNSHTTADLVHKLLSNA